MTRYGGFITLVAFLAARFADAKVRPVQAPDLGPSELAIQQSIDFFVENVATVQDKDEKATREGYDSLLRALSYFESTPDFLPVIPKPLDVAKIVLATAKTPSQFDSGRRYLRRALYLVVASKDTADEMPLAALCREGSRKSMSRRHTCQEFYAFLCALSALAGHSSTSTSTSSTRIKQGTGTNIPRSGDECVAEFNALHSAEMPPSVRWAAPLGMTRQLPGIEHRRFWSPGEVPWAEELLGRARGSFRAVQREVGAFFEAELEAELAGFDRNMGDSDVTVVDLFTSEEGWQDRECAVFPATCALFQATHGEKGDGGNTTAAAAALNEFMGGRRDGPHHDVWGEKHWNMGFRTFPALGIQIRRVKHGAATQVDIGGPGRLVSSIALSAPHGSTLTVGGEERPWPATRPSQSKGSCMDCALPPSQPPPSFVIYDDSFLSTISNRGRDSTVISNNTAASGVSLSTQGSLSTANPDLTVLSFFTWHPDLLARATKISAPTSPMSSTEKHGSSESPGDYDMEKQTPAEQPRSVQAKKAVEMEL